MSDSFRRTSIVSTGWIIVVMFIFSCSERGNQHSKDQNYMVRELASPVDSSAAEPYLFNDKQGRTYLSWIHTQNKFATLYYSVLEDGNWSTSTKISEGNDWFVNWADYPMIASDGKENMIAHYLQRSDTGTYTYDIKISISADAGKTWTQPLLLNKDGQKAEHGFVSMLPHDGRYFVSWLDGRNTATSVGHVHSKEHSGEMTLRGAYLSLAGATIDEWELDARVCDCCNTSSALTSQGPVVVYRDRSAEEVRDISIVRFVNGAWTKPLTVYADNWKFDGCPVNGPRVVALGNAVAVAWFSSIEKSPAVSVIFSFDGGATFKQRIRIDEGKALGRIDMVMLKDTSVVVSWLEGDAIKADRIYRNGSRDSSIHIASTNTTRASGFPQMTANNKEIVFAWHDNTLKTIRVATMNVK